MDNAYLHGVKLKETVSFYNLRLSGGEQYRIPFICQRCGNCCRIAFDAPCEHLREPNVCLIYDRRPAECRSFPMDNDPIIARIVCPGYGLIEQAMVILGESEESRNIYVTSNVWPTEKQVRKAANRLRRGHLPDEFIDRFITLNSLD